MKMKRSGMSLIKNPLFIIITVLIIVIIVLAIFRSVAPSLTMGLGIKAHLGDLKGSINIEGYEDPDNYEDFDNQSGSSPEFVMFYAPWCGYCKKTMPDFQELMNTYKKNIKISAIDCDADEEMAKKHNVKGYPDIRYYPNGIDKGNHEDYSGDRSLQDFKNYLDGKVKGVVEQGPDNAASVM